MEVGIIVAITMLNLGLALIIRSLERIAVALEDRATQERTE